MLAVLIAYLLGREIQKPPRQSTVPGAFAQLARDLAEQKRLREEDE
jgi:hypothetical protein